MMGICPKTLTIFFLNTLAGFYQGPAAVSAGWAWGAVSWEAGSWFCGHPHPARGSRPGECQGTCLSGRLCPATSCLWLATRDSHRFPETLKSQQVQQDHLHNQSCFPRERTRAGVDTHGAPMLRAVRGSVFQLPLSLLIH